MLMIYDAVNHRVIRFDRFCRDLAKNHITSLEGSLFRNLSHLHDLLLSHNYIATVPRDAFQGLIQLKVL